MRHVLIRATPLILLAACSGADGVTAAPSNDRDAARADGFKVVHLKANAPTQPGAAGAPLVTTLEQAVERVAAGGTIKVYPGEYIAESVLITKPVTIGAAGGEKPVIRTVNSLEGLHLQHPEGTVVLRGLEFRNDFADLRRNGQFVFSYSVRASENYANLTIEDSDFFMRTGGHASGVFYSGGGIPGNSHLIVRRSMFTGGRAAIGSTAGSAGRPASRIDIHDNRFSGHRAADDVASNFSVQVNHSNATIRNNVFTDCGVRCINAGGVVQVLDNRLSQCGTAVCIAAFGQRSARIARNQMSNVIEGEYDSWFHHVVSVFNTEAVIENNDIDGCGFGQCILGLVRAHGEIRNNRITVRHGERTRIGIVLSDGMGGNATETDRGASFVISGNTITGLEGDANTQPDNADSYPFSVAAFVNEGHSTMTAEHNTVSGASYGFINRTGSVLAGTRNALSGLRVGVGTSDEATRTTLNLNDIVAFRSHDLVDQTDTDVTCNWWGSAGGPSNSYGAPNPGTYTPWATQPVASGGEGNCTGGL